MLEFCLKRGCDSGNRVRIKGDPDQLSCRLCTNCNQWLPIITAESINSQRFMRLYRWIIRGSLSLIAIAVLKITYDNFSYHPMEQTGDRTEIGLTKPWVEQLSGLYLEKGQFREMEIREVRQVTKDSISFNYTLKGRGNNFKNKLGWLKIEEQSIYFENIGMGIIIKQSPLTLISNENEWEFSKRSKD